MRFIRLTAIAATLAALAQAQANIQNPMVLDEKITAKVEHKTCGLTASSLRVYTGTDTGSMEERMLDGSLVAARNTYKTSDADDNHFNDETNRLGGFSPVVDDVFYFCSEDDNAIYRYQTIENTVVRLAGSGEAGLVAGTGKDAQIDCGNTAVQSVIDTDLTKLYMMSGRGTATTWAIVAVEVGIRMEADQGKLSIFLGSGVKGHTDGAGTSARIDTTHGMFLKKYSDKEFLVLGSADPLAVIRWVDVSTKTINSAKIKYNEKDMIPGIDGVAELGLVTGLASAPGDNHAFGITSESNIFTLYWDNGFSSFGVYEGPTSKVAKAWGTAITPDGRRVFFGNDVEGNGLLTRLESKQSSSVVTEAPPTRAPPRRASAFGASVAAMCGASLAALSALVL